LLSSWFVYDILMAERMASVISSASKQLIFDLKLTSEVEVPMEMHLAGSRKQSESHTRFLPLEVNFVVNIVAKRSPRVSRR
jgi:hypothetical protein